MRRIYVVIVTWLLAIKCFGQVNSLPVYQRSAFKGDWLVTSVPQRAAVFQANGGKDLVLSNGLITRRFRIAPNLATVDFQHLVTNEQFVRSVRPEARLVLNRKTYQIGGLYGQKEHAYLREEWLDTFTANPADFQFKSFTVTSPKPYINWQPRTWVSNPKQPTGQELTLLFASGLPELQGVDVSVHYVLYDGISALCKWVSIENKSGKSLSINQVVNEILATPEEESAVVGKPDQMKKPQKLYVENNFAFNNAMRYDLSDQATHWKTDSLYTSQVNYNYETPCLLEVYPTLGVGTTLESSQTYTSIRSYELLLDSHDRERNGLARRRFYRTVAPWTTQNPIFMHLVSTEPSTVKQAIDQCVETGYEMVILSFGSGLNMEDVSEANIQKFKSLADYAHSKGILLGGYSLFSSRRIDDETDVIDPKTGLPDKGAFFGQAPCLASQWGINYLNKLKKFITETGFDLLEHDGPYPGDVCASTKHAGHKGLDDSQWVQMEMQKGFYHFLNEKGVYINAPDWYFMDGTNKIALGYREVNFSLSRDQQKLLNRQNIFDATWEKTPAMGWGFVPLTKYQGGGPEAVLEPLSEHLSDYEQLMMQYYGAGVQACYRGPRLYDTDVTKHTVKQVIDWYKKYRSILNADLIHLRRPDGRDWDGFLHVASGQKQKGLVMLFNPLKTKISRIIRLPLYYTGLSETAMIRQSEGKTKSYRLNRNYEVELPVEIAPESYGWWVIE
ncbi:alpha-galactosidase [Spirosoma sp. BT702]|uniref:Alpha-galactosidase n=1 Tax=Spirosoma profusum TaxID=2771354 RepID=A0A926XYB1_9BACT|nr:alpha-galactosidase [Spirosoma profusum]MBD2702997.1 alpha-galactosidase [Spirosoma profusum]